MGKGLNQLGDIRDDGVRYIRLKWASVRLAAVENISTLLSKAFGWMIFIFLIFIAFIFLMVALALWLGEILGHLSFGFLVSGGVFLLVGLVVFLLRGRLIINQLVRLFSGMFFNSDDDDGTQA